MILRNLIWESSISKFNLPEWRFILIHKWEKTGTAWNLQFLRFNLSTVLLTFPWLNCKCPFPSATWSLFAVSLPPPKITSGWWNGKKDRGWRENRKRWRHRFINWVVFRLRPKVLYKGTSRSLGQAIHQSLPFELTMSDVSPTAAQFSRFLFTSESVSEGHPDKMCDQVSTFHWIVIISSSHLFRSPTLF